MQRFNDAVQDINGNAVPTATITVTDLNSNPVTVYSSNNGPVLSQPIAVNSLGEYSFYAPNGRYNVIATYLGKTFIEQDVYLYDPGDQSGSSGIGFIQTGTGAIARNVQTKLRESISVTDYGADSTGSTDSTNSIKNAIAANPGKTILFPAGTYKVSSTITINANGCKLIGDGMWLTTITRSGDYGDTFFFTGNDATTTLLLNVSIEGMTINSTGLTTSGSHIHMNGVAHFNVREVYINNGFIGMTFNGATAGYIETTYIVFDNIFGGSVTGRRYAKFASTAVAYPHTSCGDVFVEDFNWRGGANNLCQNGIEINSADGIWFDNGHLSQCTVADVLMNANVADLFNLLFFSNVMFDAQTGAGIVFSGSSAIGANIQFTGCHCKGGGTGVDGISIGSGATFYDVTFSNCEISEYTSSGVTIGSASAKNWTFSNCQVRGNSFGASNTADGYTITAGDKIQIVGGQSGGPNIDPNAAATQRFGINIGAGALNIHVNSVDLRGNVTNAVSWTPNADTSGNRIVNCAGFNGGRAAVALAVPASTVTQKNPFGAPALVQISGGTLSSVILNSGPAIATATPTFPISIAADDSLTLTYTVAPTWTWWPQ